MHGVPCIACHASRLGGGLKGSNNAVNSTGGLLFERRKLIEWLCRGACLCWSFMGLGLRMAHRVNGKTQILV